MIQSLLSDKFEKICIILVLQLCCGASHSAENTHHLTWVSIECKSEYNKKLRIYSNVLLIEKMPTQPGHNHLKSVFQPVWAKHLFRFSATTILQWFCVHLANSGCNTLVLVRFGKTTSSKKINQLTREPCANPNTQSRKINCLMRRQMDISYHGSSAQQIRLDSLHAKFIDSLCKQMTSQTTQMKCLG